MWDIIRRSFRPALSFTRYLFVTAGPLIIAVHLLCFCLGQYFSHLREIGPQSSAFTILIVAGTLLITLTESLFYLMLVPGRFADYRSGQPPRAFPQLLQKYTAPLVLESLRVFAKTLLWTLMLVLPGLFQMWRLYLVPFIVMLNPDYDEGRLDALKHSHALIRGHDFIWVLFLFFLGLLDLSYEIVAFFASAPQSPTTLILLPLLTLPFSLYSFSLLVHVYEGLEQKLQTAASAKA